MKKLIKDFRNEILVLIVGLAIFILLAGSSGIRGMVINALYLTLQNARQFTGGFVDWLSRLISGISTFQALGTLVLILAFVYVTVRVRYRYQRNAEYDATICPDCSGQIKRAHRTQLDRFLSKLLLPGARRYRCVNPGCGWSGLRHQRYRAEHGLREDTFPKS